MKKYIFIFQLCFIYLLNASDAWIDQLVEYHFRNVKLKVSPKQIEQVMQHCQNSENKYYNHIEVYTIKNRKVLNCNENVLTQFLQAVCDEYPIPDMQFLYYNHDGVISNRQIPPVDTLFFASTKHKDMDSIIPFVDYFVSVQNGGPYDWPVVFNKVCHLNKTTDWHSKQPILHWRGANNGPYEKYTRENWKTLTRGRAVYLSQLHPHIIDAKFSHILPWKIIGDDSSYLPVDRKMGHEEQLQHKYLLCLDGNTCTFPGVRWRLLSNSLMFFPESDLEQWFYPVCKAALHYIPVKKDLSDLVEKVEWALANDEKCQKIVEESTKLIHEKLTPDMMKVFGAKMLIKYAEYYDPA